MKRILLLATGLLCYFISFGQILVESFENSWSGTPLAPTGWTQVAGQPGGGAGSDISWDQCVYNAGWICQSGGTKPTGAPEGSAVAHYNNNQSRTGQTDTLKSGTIDLSSTTNPYVSFYYNYWSGTAILKVLASADGQTNWVDISNGGIGQTSFAWLHFTYNLGAFKTSTMKIAFVVIAENNTNDIWLDHVVVDDSPLPLNGTYTIDNTLPTAGNNFSSFTDAIIALNRSGLSGPVFFNVSAGQTFVEETPIIHASGNSVNTITFQKSGNDVNPVIISAGELQTSKSGIWVRGGDYFTFDGIDVNASNSVLYAGYYFCNASSYNGSKNIVVKNCKIRMKSPGGHGAVAANHVGIPSNISGAISAITYQNIVVERSRYGLDISGSSLFPADSCIVTGCTIGADSINNIGSATLTVAGINAYYCKNVNISNNHIRNIFGAGTSTAGIMVTFVGNKSTINHNLIHGIRGTSTSATDYIYGINCSGGSLLDTMVISNNMLYDFAHGLVVPSATASVKAITLNPSSVGINKVYYNTVFLNCGSVVSSSIIYNYGGSNIIKNNILYNASPGGSTSKRYIIRHNTTGTTSNNNILLNVTGTNNFIGFNGADKITLAQWQASTGTPDLNSYSIDPMFVSNTNLHFRNKAMNDLGIPIAGITSDFDGEIRKTLTPDIGADEYEDTVLLAPIISPIYNSNNVNINTNVTFTFPEVIRNIDNTSLTNANISSLITFQDAALNNIPFSATWDGVNNTITITPLALLGLATQYTVSLSGIEDTWDNTGTFATTFTTVPIVTSVSISISSGTNPACQNSPVTFTAVPTNGGSTPSFQWMINGIAAGTDSSIFTTTQLANNDSITCLITSSDTSIVYPNSLSNSIKMQVINSSFRDTSAIVCESFTWRGTTYTNSDTISHILTNAAGCDSVITLHLTVVNISDQNVSAAISDFCVSGATTINIDSSQNGITYYLRDNANNNNLDTILGTGSAISFPVSLTATKSYNVFAERIITTNALDFNGTNQYINVPSSAELTISSSITMEAWVYIPTTFNGIRTIINKSGVSGYSLSLGNAFGDKVINLYFGSSTPRLTTPLNTLIPGVWQHIAATFDDASNQMKIYLNGNVVASGSFTGTYSGSTSPLCIGATNSGTASYFKGGMDEVRIWNTVRSQSEIQSAINSALAGTEPGLVAYYRFNEGAGTTVADIAGGNYTGTMQNMTGTNWIYRNLFACTKVLSGIPVINIHPLEDATFAYNSFSFCSNETDPVPTILGTSGGTFSANSEYLNINSTSGTIDLSNSTAGDYSIKYRTSGFCADSSNYNITINSISVRDTSASACGSFTWYGNTYTETSTQYYTVTNAVGCDSIVTLHLTINNPTSSDTTAVACGSFYWNGNIYTETSVQTHIVPNSLGCDSTISLHLTINPVINVSLGNDSTICSDNNDVIVLDAGNSGMTYLWNDSTTSQTLTVNSSNMISGIYNYSVTVTDGVCYASDSIQVTIDVCSGIAKSHSEISASIYPNPSSDGIFNLDINSAFGENFLIKVYDVSGKLVLTKEIKNKHKLQLDNIDNGIYSICISNNFINSVKMISIIK